MKTYLVNYHAGSYQFQNATMHAVSEIITSEMDDLKKEVKNTLETSKSGSTPAAGQETFWASFSEWNGKYWEESQENFKLRIKV